MIHWVEAGNAILSSQLDILMDMQSDSNHNSALRLVESTFSVSESEPLCPWDISCRCSCFSNHFAQETTPYLEEICLYFNSNQWKRVTSNRKYMCIHLLYYFTWSSPTNNRKPFGIPHPTVFLFPTMRSGLGCGWSKDEIPKRLGTET